MSQKSTRLSIQMLTTSFHQLCFDSYSVSDDIFRFLPTRLNVFVNLNCALLLLLFLFNDLQKKRIIQKEIFKKSRAKVDIYIELQYISSNPPLGFFSTNIPLIIQTTAFQNKLINLLYEKYMILGSETFYQKIISYQTISSFQDSVILF